MAALSAIRSFFAVRGYIEIEAPLLLRSPDSDPSLTPLEVTLHCPGEPDRRAACLTSPEYSMKKLLGAGMDKIFYLGKVFRDEEVWNATHATEFTMVEWYEGGMEYLAGMDQTEELVHAVAEALGVKDHPLLRPWRRVKIKEMFERHVGIVDVGRLSLRELHDAAHTLGIHTTEDDSWSDVFYRMYVSRIENTLPEDEVLVLYEYPTPQAALAAPTLDGYYAERFEVFCGRLELCNAFTELTDAVVQRARFERERQERERAGKSVFPIDEELLALLPSLRQPTFGNGLGVDRLLMALLKKPRLDDVHVLPHTDIFPA